MAAITDLRVVRANTKDLLIQHFGCGVAAAFILTYPNIPMFASEHFPLGAYARVLLILGVTGALAGILFWLIAKAEMRPNKSLERAREK